MREVDVSQRGLVGIAAVQCLVQIAHVIGWCAANHASLGAARSSPCACLLRFLVWGLRGVSMENVLMERVRGSISRALCMVQVCRLKCKPIQEEITQKGASVEKGINNPRKKEFSRRGYGGSHKFHTNP